MDSKITSFRDLRIWQGAHELVLLIYRATKNFPIEEKFALASQMRRAAISVPSNIVEGFRRAHPKDKTHFYVVANASLEELRYQVQVAHDLSYVSDINFKIINQKAEEASKMLNSWIKNQKV